MRSRAVIIQLFILVLVFLTVIRCAHLKEAQSLYSDGNYQNSITLCREAIKADTTDIEAYVLLSKNYRAADSLVQALRIIRLAGERGLTSNKLDMESALISTSYGTIAARDGDNPRALRHFKAAREIFTSDTLLIRKTADINIDLGRLEDARKDLLTLSDLKGDTVYINTRQRIISSRTASAEKQAGKGITAYKNERFKTAAALLSEARKLKSDSDEINYYYHMAKGRELYLKGRHSYKKGAVGNLWNAIELFGKAGAIDKTNPEPYYFIGLAYEKKDKSEYLNAIDAYKQSLERDPDSAYAAKCKIRIRELEAHKKKMDKFYGRTK